MEFKRVTAINGNQVAIDPPIQMTNWRTGQSPGVWWTGNYAVGDGIEGLTLDTTAGAYDSGLGTIVFFNAYGCWVKNVRTINGNRNHLWMNTSFRMNIQDNYFFGTKGGASQSYGVESFSGNSNNLIQNNICQHVVACVIVGGDIGSVYGYNYSVDDGNSNTTVLFGMDVLNHDFGGMVLGEGEDTSFSYTDNVHGTSAAVTVFRNRLGAQDTPVKTGGLVAFQGSAFNRATNVIGSVLGTSSTQTPNYQALNEGDPPQDIYRIGMQAEGYHVTNDPLTVSSLLRWGNYDVVTNAVRWCGNSSDPGWSTTCSSTSEIPTSGITFINGNPVPVSTTLPASFYLSSQPSFWKTAWGTPPWPAIGPDVTGGTAPDGVGGYSYSIPAQLCYTNTSIDPAYQQTFAVTGATWTNGSPPKATLTIGTNSLATPQTIAVSGISPSGYNGIYQITASTSTTVTYTLQTNPGTYSAGGTVTWPNIRLFNATKCYPAAYGGGAPAPPLNLTAAPH
jgi:hypothetical protein